VVFPEVGLCLRRSAIHTAGMIMKLSLRLLYLILNSSAHAADDHLAVDFFHVDCAITLKRIYVFFALVGAICSTRARTAN
jgi:hypothetical protein